MNVSVEKIDGIDAVDVDAVRVFRTIYTEADVVHVGPSELSISRLGEVCRLVELFVPTINNAVVDYDFHEAVAQSVACDTVPVWLFYIAGIHLVLQIKCNRIICWSKTGVVAASAQELEDGTLAAWADLNLLQKFHVFAVVVVFLEISQYCFFLENITGGCVYVFCATVKQNDE